MIPLTPLWRVFAPFALGCLLGYRQGRSLSRAETPSQPSQPRLSGVPGPLQTLVGFMRRGQTPPPIVVGYAIAEATMIGRADLAADLHRTFPSQAPVLPPSPVRPASPPRPTMPPADRPVDRPIDVVARPSRVPPPSVTPQPSQPLPAPPRGEHGDDRDRDEHDRRLERELRDEREHERDRERQFERRERRLEREVEIERDMMYAPPPSYPAPATFDVFDPSLMMQAAPSELPPSPMPSDDMASYDDTPVSSGSPLPGIDDAAWRSYCRALERERPDFDSGRRVGRYALRKDRLRELGCNPDVLTNHPRAQELQDTALAIDAADSAKHMASSGTLEAHLGRAIALPGEAEARKVTLSGLLGVAQVAGLEGLVGWLENPGDRKRFPHTTAMFARSNGVF